VSLAAVTLGAALLLPPDLGFRFLALLLAVAAGVYLGFGFADRGAGEHRLQGLAAIGFVGVAALALHADSHLILAVGWAAHAGWDALHHFGKLRTWVPKWYAPACVVYDLVVAAFLVALAWL
jgi:hypothetical protein